MQISGHAGWNCGDQTDLENKRSCRLLADRQLNCPLYDGLPVRRTGERDELEVRRTDGNGLGRL
jgi:hypothetical protein